ncbi:MAG: hypothetical protein ACI809_002664, partial [Candidatus Azotimanducaceae bacterium]
SKKILASDSTFQEVLIFSQPRLTEIRTIVRLVLG